MKIEFGTDGWRGIIGKDFNFKNVEKIGIAIINYLNKKPRIFPCHKNKIAIGYDTRFLGKETAEFLSELFSNSGYDVLISSSPIPTPALSLTVNYFELPLGLMITASHNPPLYNGIKIKAWYGGSALPQIYEGVEKNLDCKKPLKKSKGEIQKIDIKNIYIDYLKKNINWEKIKNFDGKIIWDSMYGATTETIKKLFGELNSKTTILNSYPDPYFGGIQPEPIPKNLRNTIEYTKRNKYDLAGTSDGDGDRIALITSSGEFLWNHTIFSLLALYYLKEKNEKKGIAKTFSSTLYLNRIVEKYNIPIYETAIGFKYLCPYLMQKKVFIAGEESGGIAFCNSLPERDAILSFLKVIEILAEKKKSLEYFLNELKQEFGELHYGRKDIKMDLNKADYFVKNIFKNPPKEICNFKISEIKKIDGVKFYFGENGWLLFRTSGTENLLRVYCEMERKEDIEEIFNFIRKYINQC